MRISEATPQAIYWTVLNARACDMRKFQAMVAGETREDVASAVAERFASPGMMTFSADGDDLPICVGGASQDRPNVVRTGFFATDRFALIARPLSRWVRDVYFPALREQGIHRIEAITAPDFNDQTDRWLEWLGLSRELTMPGYGLNGEAFATYAWVRGDYAASVC